MTPDEKGRTTSPRPIASPLRSFTRVILVAIAYFLVGRLSLRLAIPPGYASPVWPAAGIALAAVLVWGNRVWPGIVLGSFFANTVWAALDSATLANPSKSVAVAAAIAGGAALQALFGAALIRRSVGFPTGLTEERAIGKFLALGGPVSCLLNPTIGVVTLLGAGFIQLSQFPFSLWTWWIGDTIGVLLVTPLALIWTAEPRQLWRKRKVPVAIPLVLCTALVITFFFYAHKREQERLHNQFVSTTARITAEVTTNLRPYREILQSLQSFFESAPGIDHSEFQSFATSALQRHKSVHGVVGWAPRVRDDERGEYEARIRQEGMSSFQISEYSDSLDQIPAARRRDYFPVQFLEPMEGSEFAIGFDVASEGKRLAALQSAWDSGEIVVSSPTPLLRGKSRPLGMVAFAPVYEGAPMTPEERRQSLRGFCIGVFRITDIVTDALRGVPTSDINISIVDISDVPPTTVLSLTNGAEASSALLDAQNVEHPLEFGHRHWALRFFPTDLYVSKHRSWSAWTVLATGLFFTSLLGAFLLTITGRSVEVAALVDERTRALTRAEQRFRGLLESAPDAMVIANHTTIVFVNAQAEQLFGYSRGQLVGQDIELLLPRRLRERHRSFRKGYLQLPRARPMGFGPTLFARRKDGSEFPVEISLSPMQSEEGLLVTATIRDITNRKRLEDQREFTLREKETLLKEIHHRVKNNLQVVSSLFYLQSQRTDDPKYKHLLNESRDRVLSIALVHDQLYRSKNLANIDFLEYLSRLVAGLKGTYGDAAPEVQVDLSGSGVFLDIEHAVPCGLIVSELVSNAFKHAFPGGRAGTIEVSVRNEGEDVLVQVADDGVGFPDTLDWRRSPTLGLQLVSSLTTQLRATTDMDRIRGTRFCVRFSAPGSEPASTWNEGDADHAWPGSRA